MTVDEVRRAVIETMSTIGNVLMGVPASVCDQIFAPLAEDIALAYAQAAVHP